MIPIVDVAAIDLNSNVADAKKLIEQTGFSRFPIYDMKKNQIRGIIHAFYLLGRPNNELVSNLADDCFFVEENYLASRLLDELKESKSNLAVVGTPKNAVGIVTIEDILEEVLGEIEDEHDM
jgi:CBS domain containing-hemolysin-like protein